MQRSVPRSSVSRPDLLVPFLAALLFVAWTPAPVRAEVCVTIDEASDTFSPSDRSAALLLLTRPFEFAGERVVPAGCPDANVVSHVQFGTRIIITLSGPGRAGSIQILIQGDVGLPFYNLRSTTYTITGGPPFVYQASQADRYVRRSASSLALAGSVEAESNATKHPVGI